MNRSPLVLVLLIVAGVVVLFVQNARESRPDGAGKTGRQDTIERGVGTADEEPGAGRSVTRVIGGVSENGDLTSGVPETIPGGEQPGNEDGFVKNVISETWLDKEPGKAGRRRVRIVEADFKYPHIRLEEEVWTDPTTGRQTVNRIRASVADHVMVGLKPRSDEKAAAAVLEKNGYQIRAVEPGSYILAVLPDFSAAESQQESINDIGSLEEFIDYAEPDWIVYPAVVPDDPDFSNRKMWGLDNPGIVAGTTADADIDAPEAWAIRTDASNVIVAVTDTGIQYNHVDLAPNMWINGSGHHGYDAYDNDNDPMDIGGHGTHCAGTIGARGNNNIGLTGVAWNVQLMAGRFLGPNGGSTSDGIRVINYARQNGAHIISASWGGGGYSQSLYNAIKAAGDAGIPFIAAAGNDALNNDSTPHYPSSYDLPTLVAVASTTSQDRLSHFSCYGRYSVDIAAPGSGIWSCYIGSNSSYKHLNGTSMATPHVSGSLALAKAHFPSDDAGDLIARLYSSVDPVPALTGKVTTGGRLNLHKLLGASTAGVSNDDFENALRFEGGYGYWNGSNKKATREADEDSFSLPSTGTRSVWFAWKAPYQGLVEFDVEADALPLRVIAFRGTDKAGLTMASDSGTFPATDHKTLRFYCHQDQEYRFLVDSTHAAGQNLQVNLSLKPVNDHFGGALGLSGDRFSTRGSNRNATDETFERAEPHAGVGKGKSVWWKWTPDFDGEFVITTQGSEFDTVLAVYTGSNSYDLSPIVSNDDRNALDWTSQVTFTVTSGTEYYIAVDGYRGDAAGVIELNGFKSGQLALLREIQDLSVSVGDWAVFEVIVNSYENLSYQWLLNGTVIPGENSSKIVIDPVEVVDFGVYSVEVTNGEGRLVSNGAELKEIKSAPRITWSSGSQIIPTGQNAGLAVNVTGSSPLSIQWYKDGNLLAGATSNSLSFVPVMSDDVGSYEVKISNSLGEVKLKMDLLTVDSPWEGWQHRHPWAPNSEITDIQSTDDLVYAVSGGWLFYSTDGKNWQRDKFPYDFYGKTFSQIGNRRICIGADGSDDIKVAVSINNEKWQIHTPTGLEYFPYTIYPITAFKGKFVVRKIRPAHTLSQIYHSTDGVTWTASQSIDLDEGEVAMRASGSISSNGNLLIMASSKQSSDERERMRYFSSENGELWIEKQTPIGIATGRTRTPKQSVYAMGKFHLIGEYVKYTSSDGLNWILQEFPNNNLHPSCRLAGTPHAAYAVKENRWFSNDSNIMRFPYESGSSSSYSAIGFHQDRVIYGTAQGLLGAGQDVYDLDLGDSNSFSVERVLFEDDHFFALPTDSVERVLISTAGRNWSLIQGDSLLGTQHYSGKANGLYWATLNTGGSIILTGDQPYSMKVSGTHAFGLSGNIWHVSETSSGNALAIAHYVPGVLGLFSRSSGEEDFSLQTAPFNLSTGLRFRHIGGLTFTAGFLQSEMHVTTDGQAWQGCGYSADEVCVAKKNNQYLAILTHLDGRPVTVIESQDGITWQEVLTAGLPVGSTERIRKMFVHNDSYIAQIGNGLYFSNDGEVWAKASLPVKVRDVAVGNGQVVICSLTGGLLQTGGALPGLNVPVVEINSPRAQSQFISGSRVRVTGEVSDAEDPVVTYRCFVDGEVVYSGTGKEFSFDFTVSGVSGSHTVLVEGEDSQGLIGRSAIVVNITTAQVSNRLLSREGVDYVPTELVTMLNGVFYIAGKKSIYRSLNGREWSRIELPILEYEIDSLVSGNGVLLIQLKNGSILSSRNGYDWVKVINSILTSSSNDFVLPGSLSFQGDQFSVIRTLTPKTIQTVATSADGFIWETGNTSPSPSMTGLLLSNGKGVIVAGATALAQSLDNGNTWRPLEDLPSNGTDYQDGIYAGGRFVVIDIQSDIIYCSEDGINWTSTKSLNLIGRANRSLVYKGERYFYDNYTSIDGVEWNAIQLNIGINAEIFHDTISYHEGVYLAKSSGDSSIAISDDGLSWRSLTDQFTPPSVSLMTSSIAGFMVVDDDGSIWMSSNGLQWGKSLIGKEASTADAIDIGIPVGIKTIGTRLVIASNKGLFFSLDDGVSWNHGQYNGSDANFPFVKMESSNNTVFAISSGRHLFKTADGIHWTEVNPVGVLNVNDMAYNGSQWRIVTRDGKIFKSDDQAQSWIEVPNQQITHGRLIAWYKSQWVVVGGVDESEHGYINTFTMDLSDALIHQSILTHMRASSSIFKKFATNDELFIWSSRRTLSVSADATSWSRSFFSNVGGNMLSIFDSPYGLTAIAGLSAEKISMFQRDSNKTWKPVPLRYVDVVLGAKNSDGKTYIFGDNLVIVEDDYDVALDVIDQSPMSLGVGSVLPIQVSIRNEGSRPALATGWKIETWLSKNAFFGDANDVYIGRFDVDTAIPASGESLTMTATYVVPDTISVGDNYIIMKLYNEGDSRRERIYSNNVSMSLTKIVTIPEWELELLSNGNGEINQDFAALRYPHGARVSLTANAGKGAAFAGWGGDAVGAENQITILMDGDKSVRANFSSRANLQVHVRGAGVVTGLADLGSYPVGDIAALIADPADGWVFSGWSGAVAGNTLTANIMMDANKVLTATFTKLKVTWKSDHFSPTELLDSAISGDDADPDGDGLKNWQEYLHLSDPRDKNSRGVQEIKVDGGFLYAIFTRNSGIDGGLSLACQGSRDMSDWNAPDIQERILSTVDGVETVEARIPATENAKGFLRLKYNRP